MVIFDLDGTLVDAFADIAHAVNAPLAARGLPEHTVASVRTMVGSGIVELCRRAAPSLTGAEALAYLADVRAIYAAHPVVHARTYDGVPEMMRDARTIARTAVLSNKPHPATIEVCRRLGIEPHMDAIEGEDAPRTPRKPDPAGARGIMGRLGCSRAIVVGDMAPDGQLALGLGAPFIGALWSGATEEELRPLDPVALCRHPRDVGDAIRRVLAGTEPIRGETAPT